MDRDEFLTGTETPSHFEVPEWSGKRVFLRVMTAIELNEWMDKVVVDDSTAGKYNGASLLMYCLCDEAGKRIFETSDDNINAIANAHSFVLIDKIAREAMKLNLIGKEGEEPKKNDSPVIPSADSPTTSQPISAEV